MRIAVFSVAYHPFVGGAEIAAREIIRRTPDGNFSVFTNRFDAAWPAYEREGNSEIIRVGSGNTLRDYYGRQMEKIMYVFRAWRAAEKAHTRQPFTAIWAIMASYGGIAALLFKLRHPRVPLLLTIQEGDSEGHILKRVGIFYPLWKMIFKKADRIQVISNYLGDFARRHGARGPIDVVPNGVDMEKFNGESAKAKETHTTIITTSRLVPKNGVDTLIEAFAKLGGDVRLEIFGSGPEEKTLKLLAKVLKISDRVQFAGHVEPDELPKYLAKADIFVRASRSEGLGNSFLEAMAAGLPVIGTPVGGIPDFLEDRKTGLFADPGNAADLAEKIKILLKDRALAGEIAARGQRLAREKYSWERVAGDMKGIFSNLRAGKKILIATGIYPPDIGGPATYTVLMEQELPKRGFGVDHLAFTEFRRLPKLVRHLWFFWKCFWMSGDFDFVYAQDPVSVGLPALIAARLRGRKFFIRVAGDYAWEQSAQRFGVKDTIDDFQHKKYGWKVELLRKIQKFVVGRADLVVTPSNYFKKLVGGWISTPEKVHAIYNGIQLEGEEGISGAREKVILSAGRLVPWKGFDVLIETMLDLPDWRLVIVGDGPDYQNLKLKIEHLKLAERVTLAGAISREELRRHLARAGVFVLNTAFESFSFQVVEAMNAGLPVVATNIGNLEEIVTNGREGILVEPNDKAQILAAVRKIDQDKDFREMIVRNAHEKARQFSISRTVDNLVELINGHAS